MESSNNMYWDSLIGILLLNPFSTWFSQLKKKYSLIQSMSTTTTRSSTRCNIQQDDNTSNSCVTKEEVESIMKSLSLSCHNNTSTCMGLEDARCMFEEEEPSVEEVREAFLVFDDKKDGFIDAEELQRVLKVLGLVEGTSLDTCSKMIGAVDGDGDGKIDFDEFLGVLRRSFH